MEIIENETEYIVEGTVQCSSCSGTGLYKGMAERGRSAVICSRCNGTGDIKIKNVYKKFFDREKRKDVERVYQTACGYGITHEDVTNDEGKTIKFSQAGVAYEDWVKGAIPLGIEDLHCPYMHTNQRLQSTDVNALYKNRCKDALEWGSITKCRLFGNKDTCWKIYKGE